MSDQPHERRPKALVQTETPRPRKQPEPSVAMVAEMLAARLGLTTEAERERVLQAVWDLGRTQSRRLCAQVAQSTPTADQTRAEAFFALAEQGEKKQRPVHIQPPSLAEVHTAEVAALLAEQLEERAPRSRQGLYRSVQILGEQAALALLQQVHEIEAAGGQMRADGSRRTPGGVYFSLIRQTAFARQVVAPSVRSPNETRPMDSSPVSAPVSPAPEQPCPPSEPKLSWGEREHFFDDQVKAEVKTVKITLIGRPPEKIVEREKCVAFVMQQAAKIPALPAGLPLPPLEQVEATRYNVYVATKQWKKVAEAIADPEDVLIIEGFPVLDAQRGTIAVFASNVTSKKLQIAAKQPKA